MDTEAPPATGVIPVSHDALLYRIGGLAGIFGGALGILANALHPRPRPGDVGDLENFLDIVAGYAFWRIDHLAIIGSVVLGLIALVVLGRSMYATPGGAWARLAVPLALATGAVAAASFTIDGIVLAAVADDWAAAGAAGREAVMQRAQTVEYFDVAFFSVATLGLFGITQLVYALALRASGTYAPWLGSLALLGAAAGMASGTWMWFSGGVNVGNFLVLFTITSVALTVWLLAASLAMYRRSKILGAG